MFKLEWSRINVSITDGIGLLYDFTIEIHWIFEQKGSGQELMSALSIEMRHRMCNLNGFTIGIIQTILLQN